MKEQKSGPDTNPLDHAFRVRTERCEDCLYRIRYPKETRDRILGDVTAKNGFVQCHSHDPNAHVCCEGFFLAVGEKSPLLAVVLALQERGVRDIEWVTPEMYPRTEEEE